MRRNTQYTDQRGVVSFMVTLIMMLVISLIVIGFTQVTMRSRREALDKQLSSQAFYAAESGVNKAIEQISTQSLGSIENKNSCTNSGNYSAFKLDGDNVAVTCIMVNTLPNSIAGSAAQNKSFVAYINSVSSDGSTPIALTTLKFSWGAAEGLTPVPNGCTGTSGQFLASLPASCAFGLLRVDLFSVDAGKTTALYMQPLSSVSGIYNSVSMDTASHIVSAKCDTTNCQATVNIPSGTEFYLRLSSLYRDIPSFKITGNGGAVYFKDAQAVIDATGRAQDVLRRVQVRYSLSGGDETPPWAVAGQVCKRLSVVPSPYSVTSDAMCN